MAELVNLNKARKARNRALKTAEAAQNRIAFGTSTKLKKAAQAQRTLEAARLDGAKRSRTDAKTKVDVNGPDVGD